MVRGTTCLLAVVASALVSTTPLRSAEAIADVPFELYQHHLVVAKGAIGQLSNLNLLIDTGTIPSAVDQRIARKLHLQTEPAALVAFGQRVPVTGAILADGFRIGSLRTGPVPVHVSDLSYLDGVQVDAIVGLDVLSRTSFSIDYQARALNLEPADREDAVVPMEIAWPFVTVQMTIGGSLVRLLVDTGSSDLVLFRARMPSRFPIHPGEATRSCSMRPGRHACSGSSYARPVSDLTSGTSWLPGAWTEASMDTPRMSTACSA
jgi:hypothetical protein